MLLRYLKSGRSGGYLLLLLLGLMFWSKSILFPGDYLFYRGENQMPLFRLLDLLLQTPLSRSIAVLVILIVSAFLIERVNTRYSFIRIRAILASVIFLAIASSIKPLYTLHPVFPATLFLILLLYRLFDSFDKRRPFQAAFDSGLLLGTGSLFYLNMVTLLPALLIGLAILGKDYRWREPVIQLSGFIVPWILVFSYFFVADKLPEFLEILGNNIFTENNNFPSDILMMVYLGFLAVIVLAGSFFMIRQYDASKVSSRNYFSVLFVFFVFSLAGIPVIPAVSLEAVVMAAVPVTYLSTNWMVSPKSRLAGELVLVLLILAVFALQFV